MHIRNMKFDCRMQITKMHDIPNNVKYFDLAKIQLFEKSEKYVF